MHLVVQQRLLGTALFTPSTGVLVHGDGNIIRGNTFDKLDIGIELNGNDNIVSNDRFGSVTTAIIDNGNNVVR